MFVVGSGLEAGASVIVTLVGGGVFVTSDVEEQSFIVVVSVVSVVDEPSVGIVVAVVGGDGMEHWTITIGITIAVSVTKSMPPRIVNLALVVKW